MPPSKDPKKRAKQLAALRKGNTPLNPKVPPLAVNRENAVLFVKLTLAGVPPMDALTMMAPEWMKTIGTHKRRQAVKDWEGAKLVADATAAANDARWEDLEPGDRLAVALDKQLAQIAYYLFTHDYATVQGDELRKMQDARAALTAKLRDDDEGDASSPFNQLVKKMLGDGGADNVLERPTFKVVGGSEHEPT